MKCFVYIIFENYLVMIYRSKYEEDKIVRGKIMVNCRDIFTDPYKHFMYHATEFKYPGKSTGPRFCSCLPLDVEKSPDSRLSHFGLCVGLSVPGINMISHLALKNLYKSRLRNSNINHIESEKRLQIDQYLINYRLIKSDDYEALAKFVGDHSIPIYILNDFLSLESLRALAKVVKNVSFGDNDPPELVFEFLSHAECLESLTIIDNPIRELPDTVKKCKSVDFQNCSMIRSIPNLIHCESFSAINCRALEKLPLLTRCKSVTCSKCDQITKISGLLCCESLIANQCKNLSSLEMVTNCKLLKVCFCPKLVALPNLSYCEQLYIYNTPIKLLPKLHYTVNIFSGNLDSLIWSDDDQMFRYSIKGYEVDFSDLKKNPRKELVRLSRNFVNQNEFPILTTKFEKGKKILDKSPGELLEIYIQEMSKYLARDIRECNHENALQHIWLVEGIPFGDRHVDIVDSLRTLGWLFGLCIERKIPFRIRPGLNPQIYEWILHIESTLSIEWIKSQLHNSNRNYLGNEDQMLFAVGLITAGLKSYFGNERWNEIKRAGAENLRQSIESVYTQNR